MKDNALNEVIRIKKSPSTFVVMDKGFLENPNLSFKAKGILAYLLSKPDNWKVVVGDLFNHSTDGKTAIYSALKELKEQGYYVKIPVRNEKGYFVRWESTIYECPEVQQKQEEVKEIKKVKESKKVKELEETKELKEIKDLEESIFYPFSENPEMDKPYMENRERNNNYNNKKDYNNNYNKKNNNIYCKSNLSSHTERQTEEIDKKVENYIEEVKNKIRYQDLYTKDNENLLNAVVNNIVDVIASDGDSITIGGTKKPLDLVKKIFLKLKRENIAGVLQRFGAAKTQIRNVRQYLLTCIFNAGLEDDLKVNGTNAISDANGGHTMPKAECDSVMPTAATETVIRPNPKNKFNDFPQREYTKANFDELEKRFLNKRKRERIDKKTSNSYDFFLV